MSYAILQNETINGREFKTVREISEASISGAVLCGASVGVGDIFSGGGFLRRAGVEYVRPPRERSEALSEAVLRLEETARAKRVAVSGDDSSKRDVYLIKYDVAVAALAGDQSALDRLAPEAAARGETPAQLAALVRGLGDQWRAVGLMIDAAYQAHKAKLKAIETVEEIDAYDIEAGWPI